MIKESKKTAIHICITLALFTLLAYKTQLIYIIYKPNNFEFNN